MIELTFEKLSRFDRIAEPCSIAVPFAVGALNDPSVVTILDAGKPIPIQLQVTAKWPDDSIKWLLIDFQADLPGNAPKNFELVLKRAKRPEPEKTAIVSWRNNGLLLNTGELEMELNGPGETDIFGRIQHAGYIYGKGSFEGPFIGSFKGVEWTAEIDQTGWRVIKPGPLAAVVQAKGKHRSNTGEYLLDFEIELTAFAGKPWFQMDYRIINRELSAGILLEEIGFNFNDKSVAKRQIKTALATSNYLSEIQTGTGDQKLAHLIDADYLLYNANEHIPETFYGTYWADWHAVESNGVCITHYQAYQNFPKSLKVDGEGIYAGILPKGSNIQLLQGVSKTHRLLLHFHQTETGLEEINCRSLQFQLPDRPALNPNLYQEAGVFEDIYVTEKVDWVERNFLNMADSRARAYGMLNWGDAPDAGYTSQGRSNGDLVWTNNEYDFPHAAMLLFTKTAERRFFDYLLVSAQHQMDVDICHYSEDPLRYQGQITHSGRHVTGEVAPCHQWVQGLLDYYHVTGDNRALETALGIGENLKRLLEQPRYHREGGINARETGWALRSLVALYQETHDRRWLEKCERIVDHYEIWQKQYGGWLAPYTDHTVIRVPFMIAVAVNSLIRYYWVDSQPRIKRMIVAAVSDLVANCRLENGLFYYKELPSLRRNAGNPLILEALAHAYELTGEVGFLEAGMPTFEITAVVSRSFNGDKQKREDAVIQWGGPGPKMFAQAFPAIAYYYRAAVEAGIDLG